MKCWQLRYARMMFPTTRQRARAAEAAHLKNANMPRRLYKYRSFSSNHILALSESVLWMSAAEDLNDLNEARSWVDVNRTFSPELTYEELESEIRHLRANPRSAPKWFDDRQLQLTADQRKRTRDHYLRDIPDDRRPTIEAALNAVELHSDKLISAHQANLHRRGTGIISLSELPTSNVMWAHYSDSHRGFCIEYDLTEFELNFAGSTPCFPVLYRKRLPNATQFLRPKIEDVNHLSAIYWCIQKSVEWSYEQEWRVVDPLFALRGKQKWVMPKPISIILGANASRTDTKSMVSICQQRDIALVRASQKPSEFGLEVLPHR
jgi:Protein of unknown function (DUF2971)